MSEIETGAEIVAPEGLFWALVAAWAVPTPAGLAAGVAAATAACGELGAELEGGTMHYRVTSPDGRRLVIRVVDGAVRVAVEE